MIINLDNVDIVQNKDDNLIKVVQGSFVLNYYGILQRKPNDLDLIIFSKKTKSLRFLNQILKIELNKNKNLDVKLSMPFFQKLEFKNLDLNVEIILSKFLKPNIYKKIKKNLYFVKPEYAILVKIFQISEVLSNKFLGSDNLNFQKILVTLQDLKIILKNKLLFHKTRSFIKKNLLNIIVNRFIFDFFLKNNIELIWFSKNEYKFELINSLQGNKLLSKKIKSLFCLNKYSRNLFSNLMVINDYILKNKYNIITKINTLNESERTLFSNEIYLKNVNFFFNNFKMINTKNIVFSSKISPNWESEIIEINKTFPFIKILKIVSLKYKINENLNKNEILIYSNNDQEFLLNTLYKIVVLLAFI
ncbi:hypothetical protein R7V75_00110 [Mesomycoplasma ovipneumoniae]|uniref:Uncharacterized protein n=1 Tax=Mesomycoplasma ovipneumoniae TaxID=29562 RepID=A0AAJ2UC82_9BACT|nr:hypothetical protein [Mesomycoplasma ovipneumoniae]MDW2835364.1 hypothetical protein [Mesomycoplasma ovipneumoniae]MDW2860780.1 hypothetical protein [Mesomycoplasma ovipneumoniae]MDW2892448.1 hypothetical protein [Mesomycoplasma ovipneumoniae]MDW2908129.1 hypothetical protein [Mesomycoplasma ovipneumoniae]